MSIDWNEIRALTIHQPWAWAIAEGHKRVENRTWRTRYRGPLLIHAGSSRRSLHVVEDLRAEGFDVPDQFVSGAIVAVADLVEVVSYLDPGLFDDLQADWFATGPQCWMLENVRVLEDPVVCPGAQSLWRPPADVLRAVNRQLS